VLGSIELADASKNIHLGSVAAAGSRTGDAGVRAVTPRGMYRAQSK
jgi:hypothetical protein